MNTKNKTSFSIKPFFAPYKGVIVLYIFLNIVLTVANFFITIYLAEFLELLTLGQMQYAMQKLSFIFLLKAGFVFLNYLTNIMYQKYANKIAHQISLKLAEQSFCLTSETYAEHDTGSFTERIIHDPTLLMSSFFNITNVVLGFLYALAIIIYISCLQYLLGITIVIFTILSMTLQFIRAKIYKKNFRVSAQKRENMTSLTTEIIKSEKDIKSLGLEDKLLATTKENYGAFFKQNYKTFFINQSLGKFNDVIILLEEFILVALGVFLLDKSILTFASFIIVYYNSFYLSDWVICVRDLLDIKTTIQVCIQRMSELFDQTQYKTETFGAVTLSDTQGRIEFNNVSFSYKTQFLTNTMNNEKLNQEKKKAKTTVLHDISFIIEPNTTVAFVGKSGSGKTTLLNLMSKMYTANSGTIYIDNTPINDITKESLRNTISLVNQFPYIFDMSIKDNLLLVKPNATDEELWDVLDKASMQDFVKNLQQGLDTVVGESGIKLSGGQRQRLAIARAFLRHTPITIFDESTSSLDNFAQNDIKHSIDVLKGSGTIIIVAHRLSTIKNVDKIYFLENGTIIDQGTFTELFNRNKLFKQMFYAENLEEE